MKKKLEDDLKLYIGQIEDMNKELTLLEEKKREIVRVGTRLEGVVAYLRKAIEEINIRENESTEPPK